MNDSTDHARAWREYEVRHREPADEGAYVAWLNAGPANTASGTAFAVMLLNDALADEVVVG